MRFSIAQLLQLFTCPQHVISGHKTMQKIAYILTNARDRDRIFHFYRFSDIVINLADLAHKNNPETLRQSYD